MNAYKKSRCPECGAVNGPGAPRCHACGLTLSRLGYAARPVDDEDDEPPRKPAKKPAPDAVQKGAPPPKKKPSRPVEDEEDDYEEGRRPAKKPKRRDEESVEEAESIRDNAILNMFFPVGVPLLAMAANYLGVFSLLGVLVGGAIAAGSGQKIVGMVCPGIGALLGLIAIGVGGLSFVIRPKKTTYGSVTGYVRAIIGIICGLVGLVGGIAVPILLSMM